MAQNGQQDGFGQNAPLPSPPPAGPPVSAGFEHTTNPNVAHMANLDPALFSTPNPYLPCPSFPPPEQKKRSRDDEDGEVLGRNKATKISKEEDHSKASTASAGGQLGQDFSSEQPLTPMANGGPKMMTGGSVNPFLVEASVVPMYPSPDSTPAPVPANPLSFQPSNTPTQLILKMKSQLGGMKQTPALPQQAAAGYPSPDDNGQRGMADQQNGYPTVGDNGVGQEDTGYQYPSPCDNYSAYGQELGWTGQPSSYNQMYDSYGMQQDCSAYSGAPGDSYEVNGQSGGQNFAPVMYTSDDVRSIIANKEAEFSEAYSVQLEKLDKSWQERVEGQRKFDFDDYTKLISMKDELISDLQGSFNAQAENRQNAFVAEYQAEVSRVKEQWNAALGEKDSRIEQLENQLNQLANAPPPQPTVVYQIDPRVEGLQAQIDRYAAAEQARANLPEPTSSNDQKLTEDVRVARQIADDLNGEKIALEQSEKKLKKSVDSLNTSNEELGKKLVDIEEAVKQLTTDKEAADGKVSALQKQIDETSKVYPDTEAELAALKSKVEALEKANKKIPTLMAQLKKSLEKVESLETTATKVTGELEVSKEKVKSLEPAANKIPAITKELEESKAKVLSLETAASEHVCPVLVRAITQENGTQTSKETGPKQPTVSRHQRYKARKEAGDLISQQKMYEDQKIDLAEAEANLKTTKSQMDNAIVKNTLLTESFRAKSCELTKITKYRDILARILIILVMILYAAALCIPHLLPKPMKQASSFQIIDTTLTSETIPTAQISSFQTTDSIITSKTLAPDDPNYYANIAAVVEKFLDEWEEKMFCASDGEQIEAWERHGKYVRILSDAPPHVFYSGPEPAPVEEPEPVQAESIPSPKSPWFYEYYPELLWIAIRPYVMHFLGLFWLGIRPFVVMGVPVFLGNIPQMWEWYEKDKKKQAEQAAKNRRAKELE